MGSGWDWERVKMLRKSSTEQSVWRVLVCHPQRQLVKTQSKFYIMEIRNDTQLPLCARERLHLSFSQLLGENRYHLFARRARDSSSMEQHVDVMKCFPDRNDVWGCHRFLQKIWMFVAKTETKNILHSLLYQLWRLKMRIHLPMCPWQKTGRGKKKKHSRYFHT